MAARGKYRTKLQQAMDIIGTRQANADLLQNHFGYNFTRQGMDKIYHSGRLPFLNGELYAPVMARAAIRAGMDSKLDDLIDDLIGAIVIPPERVLKTATG